MASRLISNWTVRFRSRAVKRGEFSSLLVSRLVLDHSASYKMSNGLSRRQRFPSVELAVLSAPSVVAVLCCGLLCPHLPWASMVYNGECIDLIINYHLLTLGLKCLYRERLDLPSIYYRRRQGHCATWQQRYAEVQSW